MVIHDFEEGRHREMPCVQKLPVLYHDNEVKMGDKGQILAYATMRYLGTYPEEHWLCTKYMACVIAHQPGMDLIHVYDYTPL